MISIAYAMGTGGGAQGAQGGFSAFIPLILMFVIFYFLLIRPQQKRQKEHQEMVNNLKKGDRIMTNGGIYGRITAIDEKVISLEIANKISIKINQGYVASLDKPSKAQEKQEKNDNGNSDKQLKSK